MADRAWTARLIGAPTAPGRLDTELYPDIATLRAARVAEDARLTDLVDGKLRGNRRSRVAACGYGDTFVVHQRRYWDWYSNLTRTNHWNRYAVVLFLFGQECRSGYYIHFSVIIDDSPSIVLNS